MVRAWPLVVALALSIHVQSVAASVMIDFAELAGNEESTEKTAASLTRAPGANVTRAPTKAPASAAAVEPKAPAPGATAAPTTTEKPTEKLIGKLTLAPKLTVAPVVTPIVTSKETVKPTAKPTEKPTEKPTSVSPATTTPTEKSTEKPTKKPTEKPTEKPTDKPTVKPTDASLDTSSTDGDGSNDDDELTPVTPEPPTPTETPTATASPTPAPPTGPNACDTETSSVLTKFYENNSGLESECAAATGDYRFPFDGTPTREQLITMGQTSACTVLMQAVLQIVPSECDVAKVALRSTAEAVLQLAEDLKTGGSSTAALPSADAITQAIAQRRKELINDPSADTTSASPKEDATTTGWGIAKKSATDDGGDDTDGGEDHVLLDDKLTVVGIWSDVDEGPVSGGGGGGSSPVAAATEKPKTKDLSVVTESHPHTSSASALRSAWTAVAAAVTFSLLVVAN